MDIGQKKKTGAPKKIMKFIEGTTKKQDCRSMISYLDG